MELLETQDPEKKRLIETSDRHKRAMEKELSDFTTSTDKILRNALIIGGSLALTFLIISSVSKGNKKKKRRKALAAVVAAGDAVSPTVAAEEEDDDEPSVLGQVGSKILNQASLILLDLARQKLNEYLATRKNADEHS